EAGYRVGGDSGMARLSLSLRPPAVVALLQENVGRLQVPVDDPFAVGHVDGPGEGLEEPGRLARRPGVGVQAIRQAAPLDPLPGPTPPRGRAGPVTGRPRRGARGWGAAPAPPAPPRGGPAAPGRGTRTRRPGPSSGRPAGGGPGATPCTRPPCRRGRPPPGFR